MIMFSRTVLSHMTSTKYLSTFILTSVDKELNFKLDFISLTLNLNKPSQPVVAKLAVIACFMDDFFFYNTTILLFAVFYKIELPSWNIFRWIYLLKIIYLLLYYFSNKLYTYSVWSIFKYFNTNHVIITAHSKHQCYEHFIHNIWNKEVYNTKLTSWLSCLFIWF